MTGHDDRTADRVYRIRVDIAGVVDPVTLKVYDTANLRIVDASLMPMLIAAHLQRTVYAIAERVSEPSSLSFTRLNVNCRIIHRLPIS